MKFSSISLAATILSKSAANAQISTNHRLGASTNDRRELQLESSSMSVDLLAANSESEQNGDGGGPGPSPVSKSAKSAKSSKSIKCEQDDFLVARYGKQLCPSEVEAKYTKLEDMQVETRGLQNFLQSNFSTPLIDTFTTYGQVELTRAQIESICITKCENDPNCGAVYVESIDTPPGEDECERYTGKTKHECIMFNPALGPGAYLQDSTGNCDCELATFLKKSSTPPPSFDLVQCNVDGAQLDTSIICELGRLSPNTKPPGVDLPPWAPWPLPSYICNPLLTKDWNTYITPGAECLGPTKVAGCFECILGTRAQSLRAIKIEEICPADADSTTTIIRDPNQCGNVCEPEQCEDKVATALLCVTGVETTIGSPGNKLSFAGLVNSPESSDGHFEAFTCPPV